MNRNHRVLVIFGISLIVIFIVSSYLRRKTLEMHHLSGQTMGTIGYHVKYIGTSFDQLELQIANELRILNQSLSTYLADSEISELNKKGFLTNQSNYFLPILEKSKNIYEQTGGAFDPSIGPLVQAWGFGKEKKIPNLEASTIDSLRKIIGFDKVIFTDTSVAIPPNHQIDFSAIAKGYAVDLVSELLERNGIENYLVEIGGEVRCSGTNATNKSWSLGIEDPTVKINEHRIMAIVGLKDRSLATSGNYRNYYEKGGKTYAHIIDPRTGYPASNRLLSASVFATDCITADAYATAFMVLGLEESKRLIYEKKLDAILFYRGKEGEIKNFVSEGIKKNLKMNESD